MAETLIAFYSHSGNTRRIAEFIKDAAGGTLFELQPVTEYPQSYDAVVKQAKKEIQAGFLPPLQTPIPDLTPFSRIFVGSPNWWSTLAPPVAAFLSAAELSGRTILPFFTHGGGGGGQMEKDLAARCPNATIKPGLVISGDGGRKAEALITAWLKSTGASE